MAARREGERAFGNDAGAMPAALRPVPEEVIAWVKRLNPGALSGFPEDGLTLGRLAALTCAYYAEVGADPDAREGRFWIWQCLEELRDRDPVAAFDCVVLCIAQCDDPQVLGCIAAGPLEDLIAYHGKLVIDRIEQLARRQPRFRYALYGVWQLDEDDGSEVWQRVLRARAAGPHLDQTDRVPDWVWG